MSQESIKDRILLNRLTYFFKRFKPAQKKQMAGPIKDFLAETPEKAPRSKNLSKILNFMTQKVFKPIGKFGRIIAPSKQSPQILKRRRERWKPTFLSLHRAPAHVQRRCCGCLTQRSRSRRKNVQSIENER